MSFWDKALGTPVRQAPAAQPHWSQPQPYQQPQQGIPQGLAVGAYERATDQAGLLAAQQGFIQRPPEWVRSQPTDHCPECDGVNFARHGQGEGTYGKLRTTSVGLVEFGHCFDCGFTLNGGHPMSDGQIGNAHSHGALSTGAVVQATRQPHGMQNFFEIK